LPSQEGFGTDLMAQNVIVPVIDLTSAAEGSTTPQFLQTAIAFGSQTAFTASIAGVTIGNTPGFYRAIGTMTVYSGANAELSMSDGLASKIVYKFQNESGVVSELSNNYDFIFYLSAGESLIAKISAATARHFGSIRQVADNNGNLVNPSGFSPQ
jgi:hypothetical protein